MGKAERRRHGGAVGKGIEHQQRCLDALADRGHRSGRGFRLRPGIHGRGLVFL